MKRHAIKCWKIGESKTSPGFYKYEVTIQEKNGDIHTIPAYGKDMQDAISRLVWKERATRVKKKPKFTLGFIFAWLFTIIVPAIISAEKQTPIWILSSIFVSMVIGLLVIKAEKFYNKH